MSNRMQKGFTLVQLGIVLIIIGLLIGGVLAGRSMLDTSKALRLASDLEKYQAAFATFWKTYKLVPGDSPAFTPPGNGDNILNRNGAGRCTGIYSNNEGSQLWAHLSQAEMLEKTYVPWAPGPTGGYPVLNCGGTQSNDGPLTAGLTGPYTELTGVTQQLLGYSKYPLLVYKYYKIGWVLMDLQLDPGYVIPLENKFGTGANNMYNTYGVGYCRGANGLLIVPCSDPTATQGYLRWMLQGAY